MAKSSSYRRHGRSNTWLVVLVCLAGLVIGGYLAYFLSQWEMFRWAGVALEIGTESPWDVASPLFDTSILLKMRFNIGSLLGLLLSYIIYKMVRR